MKSFTELKEELARINEEYIVPEGASWEEEEKIENEYMKAIENWDNELELFIKCKYPEVYRQIFNFILPDFEELEDILTLCSTEKSFIRNLIDSYNIDKIHFYNIDIDKYFNKYFDSKQ